MFKVQFKKSVVKDLRGLPPADKKRILEQLGKTLAKDPYQGKALSGDFKGLYRWRIGRFRVIYEIQEEVLLILVLKIGHRKDVYR